MQQKFSFIHAPRYKWILSLAYGLFLYVFLMLFLPFGVSNYDPDHEYTFKFLLELSVFIPVTFVASLFNEFLFKPFFKIHNSFGFYVLWTIWSMLFLSLVIFTAYNYLGNWHDWKLSSIPGFVFNTSTVLIFPAVGLYYYFRHKSLQEQYDAVLTNAATGIDESLMLEFSGEGTKDRLSVSIRDFIYARAQDNYIELHYKKNDGTSKFLIRSSLSKFHSSLKHDFLIRCHRSYLINLYNVHSIKGNRRELRINMVQSDVVIPVSQTYVDATLKGIRKYKHIQ